MNDGISANMNKRVKIPEQPADARIRNFEEVVLGYDGEAAVSEAKRCLRCKNPPCVKGCPVNVAIPEFIEKIAGGEFESAYDILRHTNSLPAVCGRVCPQETQCERLCVRAKRGEPVAIGKLERFAADYILNKSDVDLIEAPEHAANKPEIDRMAAADYTLNETDFEHITAGGPNRPDAPDKARKVAVIGSGPASLTCAGDLGRLGYVVTIFESLHIAGGVLMYGIPEFRLPKRIVQKEISILFERGVNIEYDTVVGKTVDFNDLYAEGYEAIFIGTGAGLPEFLGIPGENLCGVYTANEFLTRVNLMQAYKFPETDTPVIRGGRVIVVGGGNVAVDAARCAKRLGAQSVHIVYRRTENEMPARAEEVLHAQNERILIKTLANPVRLIGGDDGWVKSAECISMELGEPDASGRRRPVPKPGSEFIIEADIVIIAIGQKPNPIIRNATPALTYEPWGGIAVDPATCATSVDGIYAGGDAVTGAATVIEAMGAGRIAASSIDKYLKDIV